MENSNALSPVILLAGGKSSRMGSPKGLISIKGRSLLEVQLEFFRAAGAGCAIVVLGFQRDAYLEKLPFLAEAERSPFLFGELSVSVAINPRPEFGQFSSLKFALARAIPLAKQAAGFFVLPVDVLSPGRETWLALEAFARRVMPDAVIPELNGDHGHPVWISKSFAERLLAIPVESPEARLDLQIRALPPNRRAYLAVSDPGIRMNLNTPEDVERELS